MSIFTLFNINNFAHPLNKYMHGRKLMWKKQKQIKGKMPDIRKIEKSGEWKETEDKKLSRKEKKAIEEELINIYKNPDGTLPDMTKIERKKVSKAKIILVGLVVFFAFLAVLSWLGFFLFSPQQKFSGEKVELKVEAPKEVAGGEEITYLIIWKNNESVPLGQAEIEVRYPEKFIFEQSKPAASENSNFWRLGSIASGESGKIEIKGRLVGEINSLQTLQAILTYKPADFNSNFQKIAAASSEIKNSLLQISLEGQNEVLVNDKVGYKIKYRNLSSTPFENVMVEISYPENFVFDSAKPETEENDNTRWLIPSLENDKENEIELTGAFVGDVSGQREFKARIGFFLDNKFYFQSETTFPVEILKSDALLTLLVNGKNQDQNLNFGDMLNCSIVYKNNSQVEMNDVEIKAIFQTTSKNNTGLLDWQSLIDEKNGVVVGNQISPDIREGNITWTKRQIVDLASLSSGKEGTINFQIKIKNYELVKNWQLKNFEVQAYVEMKIGKLGSSATEPKIIKSNTIVFKLNSDTAFLAFARYFNDDDIAVGYGPVPPKVGETTAYRIFWRVTNSLHEIKNLKIKTVLPENVRWSEKYQIEAGNINYNPATREVTWTLNRLPNNVLENEVNFEITVLPKSEDKGKLLKLTNETSFEAIDAETGGTITLSSPELTSNLDGDPQVEGKGIVIE